MDECASFLPRMTRLSSHKAFEPPGEAKSDLEIFLDYSKRMSFKDKDGQALMPFKTSEKVFEAWKKDVKGSAL